DRDKEREQPRAFDVAEELKAQAAALVRSLDDSRDVGGNERAIVAELHDSEIGTQGREWILGDLGTGRGNNRQQRRLPSVWLPDETDVGDELELELERAPRSILTRLILARRLMRRRCEPRIPFSTPTTGSDE